MGSWTHKPEKRQAMKEERQRGRDEIIQDSDHNDCEDQGFSRIEDGCNVWPCHREPLVKWALGWRCTRCGACY